MDRNFETIGQSESIEISIETWHRKRPVASSVKDVPRIRSSLRNLCATTLASEQLSEETVSAYYWHGVWKEVWTKMCELSYDTFRNFVLVASRYYREPRFLCHAQSRDVESARRSPRDQFVFSHEISRLHRLETAGSDLSITRLMPLTFCLVFLDLSGATLAGSNEALCLLRLSTLRALDVSGSDLARGILGVHKPLWRVAMSNQGTLKSLRLLCLGKGHKVPQEFLGPNSSLLYVEGHPDTSVDGITWVQGSEKHLISSKFSIKYTLVQKFVQVKRFNLNANLTPKTDKGKILLDLLVDDDFKWQLHDNKGYSFVCVQKNGLPPTSVNSPSALRTKLNMRSKRVVPAYLLR